MYEAVDTNTSAFYQAWNVAELREQIEENIDTSNFPAHYKNWSNSKCIRYLIEAGYIVPFAGPDWFMELKRDMVSKAAPPDKQHVSGVQVDLIARDGSIINNGYIEIITWENLNHVRVLFRNGNQVLGEVFMPQSSFYNFWALLGRHIGFDSLWLQELMSQLPPIPTYVAPQSPKSFKAEMGNFNILDAINELNIDLRANAAEDSNIAYDDDDDDYDDYDDDDEGDDIPF